MGFKREACRAIAGVVLLSVAAGAAADPREPLAITQLPDSEFLLQPSAVSGSTDGAISASDMDSFSRAINEAVRAQQQSIAAQCESAPRATGPIAARWAWEAHCRYQRY